MILVDVNVLLYAQRADARGNLVGDAYHAALAIETGRRGSRPTATMPAFQD